MSVAWIPPGDYREGVRKIIYYPKSGDLDFDEILSASTEEDLKASLKVLERSYHTVTRIKKINTELKRRKRPSGFIGRSAWNEWFTEEWNNIRRAAARLQEA